MHGIKYISLATSSKIRRCVWLLLTTAGIGYFCFAAGSFLHDCRQNLLRTNIRVEQTKTIKFPTVTICNQNMFADSYVKGMEQMIGSNALSTMLIDMYSPDPQLPPPLEKYSIDNPKYTYFHSISGEANERFIKNAAHPLNRTFINCRVFGKTTNCSDVFDVVPTNAGFCFQFNGNGLMNATAAGKTGGVEFTLDTLVKEYSAGPNSASEGFSITFNEANEFPLVDELGVGVAPGTQTSIALHKSKIERYPPWADGGRANCFDTLNLPNPLHHFSTYSRSACQAECIITYVIKKCGCKHPIMPLDKIDCVINLDPSVTAVDNSSVCTPIQVLYCSQPAILGFAADIDGLAGCDCPSPCIDSDYSAKISTYKFPSTSYMKQHNTSEDQMVYMKKNYVIVNIFYGKLFYSILKEDLAYGFIEAMSNVGGTLGLCIGASLLTVFEFFQFGILSITRFMKPTEGKDKGSVAKVGPAT